MKLIKFNYKKIKRDKYLIINENGNFLFLNEDSFNKLINKNYSIDDNLYKKLLSNNFIVNRNEKVILNEWYERNISLSFTAPELNIIVLTNLCNHNCLYCQTNPSRKIAKNMDIETANLVCDFILNLPRSSLTIEFQGGEPLLNWEILKYIVNKMRKQKKAKEIYFSLVSNLSTLSYDKVKFLVENDVAICTSLDGPPYIHNINRNYLENNSYEKTVNGIKLIRKLFPNYKKVFALLTVTRFSLSSYKEIIEEYIKLDLPYIFIRPLSPMGNALKNWKEIGYDPEEFIKFYKDSLFYIINLNIDRNIFFIERMALMILKKIILKRDHKYLDLRSPCGASIGQIVYNYNGDVYPCDEARMIEGDKFKIGNIRHLKYDYLYRNKMVRKILLSSILDSDLECSSCVYKPYCGKCPMINYVSNGDMFLKSSYRCEIYKGIIEHIFLLMENRRFKKVFNEWLFRYYGKSCQA